jgi:SAM-dependent methyltransferase
MNQEHLLGRDSTRILPRRKKPTVPFYWPEWIIQREIASETRKALMEVGRGRVLDLGCGEKPYELYRPAAAVEWIGLDVPENPTADVAGYAESLPFEAGEFDTVLCTEVLEHVADPAIVVQEIARVLKPGGYVFLTTPFYWPLHEEPHDYFRFTQYGLRHLFEKAGLEIVRMTPTAGGFRMIALAVNTCFNNFGKRLPAGNTIAVKALFIPIYIASNLLACVMAAVFPSNNNAVGTAVLARKPLG